MISKIFKFIGVGCLTYLILVALIGGLGWYFTEGRDTIQARKTLKCIENMDFVQARVHLNKIASDSYGKLDDVTREKVCRAQVFHLINQGEFTLAQQIAQEDGLSQVYMDALLVQLPQIYGQQPILSLLNALSIITFSREQEEYNTQVHAYNTSLDSFCKSLYAMGKKEDAKAFLNLLKPDYNGSTTKINKIKSQYR